MQTPVGMQTVLHCVRISTWAKLMLVFLRIDACNIWPTDVFLVGTSNHDDLFLMYIFLENDVIMTWSPCNRCIWLWWTFEKQLIFVILMSHGDPVFYGQCCVFGLSRLEWWHLSIMSSGKKNRTWRWKKKTNQDFAIFAIFDIFSILTSFFHTFDTTYHFFGFRYSQDVILPPKKLGWWGHLYLFRASNITKYVKKGVFCVFLQTFTTNFLIWGQKWILRIKKP